MMLVKGLEWREIWTWKKTEHPFIGLAEKIGKGVPILTLTGADVGGMNVLHHSYYGACEYMTDPMIGESQILTKGPSIRRSFESCTAIYNGPLFSDGNYYTVSVNFFSGTMSPLMSVGN